MTFADAAQAWLSHGERKRNLKRSTVKDYRQVLDAYLLPAPIYSGDYDFYSRDDIDILVSAAASEQDAAVFLTAAMTGLRRGELVALRWRDVDFLGHAIRVRANHSFGELVTPKSGKVRSVPMVPDVAQTLARLANRSRT